jgi:DNA-binding LacI/PurR family transcriptional regulator
VPGAERSTIEDVAHAAGVSVATVSRALRGLPNVASSTRARVEEAARDLNYRPDPNAARLATGRRSRTVAVVVPFINSWYFANVIAGAEAVCADGGYDVLVLTSPSPASRADPVGGLLGGDRQVDGMIFVEVALESDDIDELERLGVEVVTIGQRTDHFPALSIDNVAIGRLAVEHLVALGHRRIGVIAGQAEDPEHFDVPGQRIEGARQALADAGQRLDDDLVTAGQFTIEGGYRAAQVLLARTDRPTALFALSDEMALGALLAARDLGLDVPADLSLVGVDDHEVAEVIGLTTVRQHVVEHGAIAARTLLRQLSGGRRSTLRRGAPISVDEAELVVRRSTQAPAAGAAARS